MTSKRKIEILTKSIIDLEKENRLLKDKISKMQSTYEKHNYQMDILISELKSKKQEYQKLREEIEKSLKEIREVCI